MTGVISLNATNAHTVYKWKQEGQPFHSSRQAKLVLLDVIWLLLYLPAFGDSLYDISPAQNTGKL